MEPEELMAHCTLKTTSTLAFRYIFYVVGKATITKEVISLETDAIKIKE